MKKEENFSVIDGLAVIGFLVWFFGIFVLRMMGKIQHFEHYRIGSFPLLLALYALWILLGIAGFLLYMNHVRREDDAYRAVHVTCYAVDDGRFGTVTFDFDDVKKSLTVASSSPLPSFVNDSPATASLISMGDRSVQEGIALLLEALHAAYDRQEEIFAAFLDYITACCEAAKVKPPLESLRQKFVVASLTVSDDNPEKRLSILIEGHRKVFSRHRNYDFYTCVILRRSPDGGTWEIQVPEIAETSKKK